MNKTYENQDERHVSITDGADTPARLPDLKAKSCLKNPFLLLALTGGLGLMLASRVAAQSFTTLYSFTTTGFSIPYTNSDGAQPHAGLILSGETLYGTGYFGGSGPFGVVFAVKIDGTGFTTLHNFAGFAGGSDGALPYAGLILSGNTLYGTTEVGGSWDKGTVFKVSTDGTGFTTLHSFTAFDGEEPMAGLVLSDNTLYGTAYQCNGQPGVVFAVNIDGNGFTNLHRFDELDGFHLNAGLILSGNTLYGTAYDGGSSSRGTVFAVNTDGTGFTTLYSFTEISVCCPSTNSDGAGPGGLILSGNTLYGTAVYGGGSDNGTVFKVNTDGTGFTTLHSFTATTVNPPYINSDGAQPWAGFILSGNTLYGTAYIGGTYGSGTVFALNTDGTGFTTLHSFTQTAGPPYEAPPYTNSDGGFPKGGLVLSGNTLYGTAERGGSSGNGTVFAITLPASPPELTISATGGNVILTWPTNAIGFTLQSTTSLSSPVWTTNLPAAVVVNGMNTVTNPLSDVQQFFRLSQ